MIYLPGSREPFSITKAVSPKGSILLAELVAILVVLEFIVNSIRSITIDSVSIFSDSQSAIGLLELGWSPNSHHTTIREIQEMRERLKALGITSRIE